MIFPKNFISLEIRIGMTDISLEEAVQIGIQYNFGNDNGSYFERSSFLVRYQG